MDLPGGCRLKTLKRLARPILSAVRRRAALQNIKELEKCEHVYALPISKATQETLKGELTEEEANWIRKIEARRSDLLADRTIIEVTDFGAGSPNSNRSLEEASKGRVSETQISKIARASKGTFECMLLFKLIRHLLPENPLEMGTCVGISASYQTAALKLNGRGHLITLEGSEATAEVAKSTLSGLGLEKAEVHVGPFHKTLAKALESHKPIDFLFNDGHHDGKAVLSYFKQSLPHLASKAVIFVDDIRWSESMTDSWMALCRDTRISLSIDFGGTGLIVWDPENDEKHSFSLKL